MIPWIQVYSNLPTHPKTARLAEALGLSSAYTSPSIMASGILVGLWTWAIQNAYDGDLSACSPSTIADACRWKKKPGVLVSALMDAGFLDDDMRLHDWDEYALLMMDSEDNRREKARDRAKRYRDKKRNVTVTLPSRDGNGDADVTHNARVTASNAATGHNITRHNSSQKEETSKEEKTVVLSAYASKINPTPSAQCVAELEAFADDMGAEVCLRAMDIALDAKITRWSYIRAILRNAKENGVRCLADFEALQEKRSGKQTKENVSELAREAVRRIMEGQ